MKGPMLAAVLSGILPGAGQIYNRSWAKGIGFLIPVLLVSAVLRRNVLLSGGSILGLLPRDLETWSAQLLLLVTAIWSVMDAYRAAGVKKSRG